jgi:hypothetical protein
MCELAGTAPKIHESAIDRVRRQTEGYSPGNVPGTMTLVTTRGGVSRYASTPGALKSRYSGASSLLDRRRSLILLRRISHYVFIVLSLALLGALLWPQIQPEKGAWHVIKAVFAVDENSLIEGFKARPVLGSLLVALTLVFLVFQIRLESRLKNAYSGFWLDFWRGATHGGEAAVKTQSAEKAA